MINMSYIEYCFFLFHAYMTTLFFLTLLLNWREGLMEIVPRPLALLLFLFISASLRLLCWNLSCTYLLPIILVIRIPCICLELLGLNVFLRLLRDGWGWMTWKGLAVFSSSAYCTVELGLLSSEDLAFFSGITVNCPVDSTLPFPRCCQLLPFSLLYLSVSCHVECFL